MTTIADVQAKIFAKCEQKYKGTMTSAKIFKALADFDTDKDGFITINQFKSAVEINLANSLSEKEAEFLFMFWDTMAGQQEPQGAIEIALAVQDLVGSQSQYGTVFNSGEESIKANKGAKGNLPSQEGGIFGGGSYAADAQGSYAAPKAAYAPQSGAGSGPTPRSDRPRGNQSSIPGGIFGGQEEMAVAPPSSRANKSNQSSVAGGIFAPMDENLSVAPAKKFNSNRSSIPGGIFGSD